MDPYGRVGCSQDAEQAACCALQLVCTLAARLAKPHQTLVVFATRQPGSGDAKQAAPGAAPGAGSKKKGSRKLAGASGASRAASDHITLHCALTREGELDESWRVSAGRVWVGSVLPCSWLT